MHVTLGATCGRSGPRQQITTASEMECVPTPPPKYLRLDGGKDLSPAGLAGLGYYELEPRLRSHGRAVWKHVSGERWLWYNAEIRNWMVGTKDKIGSKTGTLSLADTCESPDSGAPLEGVERRRWLGGAADAEVHRPGFAAAAATEVPAARRWQGPCS